MNEILEKYGKLFVEQLKEKHIQAGQVASGKSLKEFCYEATDKMLIVYGADHSEYLERGRGAGKMPPIDVIYNWSISKKFSFDKEYKRKSFAYLVARKIATSGSYLYRSGVTYAGVSHPISSIFTEDLLKQMTNEIAESFLKDLKIDKIFEKWERK